MVKSIKYNSQRGDYYRIMNIRSGDDDDKNESSCQDKGMSMNSDEKVVIRQIPIDVNQGNIDVTVDINAATNNRKEVQTILDRTAWSKYNMTCVTESTTQWYRAGVKIPAVYVHAISSSMTTLSLSLIEQTHQLIVTQTEQGNVEKYYCSIIDDNILLMIIPPMYIASGNQRMVQNGWYTSCILLMNIFPESLLYSNLDIKRNL